MSKTPSSTDAINILKQTLTGKGGFILIYNAETEKVVHLWKNVCGHQAEDLMKNALITMAVKDGECLKPHDALKRGKGRLTN